VLLDTCPAFGYANRKEPAPPRNGPTPVNFNFNEYNADMQQAAHGCSGRGALPVELTQTDVFAGKRTGLLDIVSWAATTGIYDVRCLSLPCVFVPGYLRGRPFLPAPGRSCQPRRPVPSSLI